MKPKWTDCPYAVSQRCMDRAWADSCRDRDRRLLEAAHHTIERLMARLATQAKVLEVVEAELASRQYPLLDDDCDDPGMSL